MEIYLDNSATTRVCREAADAMMTMLVNNYGNPSSLHRKGVEASKALEKSREIVAGALSVTRDEIYSLFDMSAPRLTLDGFWDILSGKIEIPKQ